MKQLIDDIQNQADEAEGYCPTETDVDAAFADFANEFDLSERRAARASLRRDIAKTRETIDGIKQRGAPLDVLNGLIEGCSRRPARWTSTHPRMYRILSLFEALHPEHLSGTEDQEVTRLRRELFALADVIGERK
jgi:hypothetical protein